MIEPLAAVRAIHFAAASVIAGAAAFPVLIAEPGGRQRVDAAAPIAASRRHVALLGWLGLAAALASGAAWLLLLAAEIGDETWTEGLRDGTAWTVLTDTRFGALLQLRLLLAAGLAALFVLSRRGQHASQSWLRVAVAVVAAALLASLAWAGHAGGAPGIEGGIHLLADLVHVLAGSLWIGGLLPLALLMRKASRSADRSSVLTSAEALQRFSGLGAVAVAMLIASGLVNTWYLTDHMRSLLGSAYGQVLLIKVGLFLAMLAFAADNRLRLLPRVARGDGVRSLGALRRLCRNTLIELGLGLAVLCAVGVLGLMPPAGHMHHAAGF